MNINIDPKTIPAAIKAKASATLRHAKFIFIVGIVVIIGFLVYEINRLTSKEPTAQQLSAQQEIIKRPKIDQETIDKIEQLEDQNIAVQSLFKTARDNPFQD